MFHVVFVIQEYILIWTLWNVNFYNRVGYEESAEYDAENRANDSRCSWIEYNVHPVCMLTCDKTNSTK